MSDFDPDDDDGEEESAQSANAGESFYDVLSASAGKTVTNVHSPTPEERQRPASFNSHPLDAASNRGKRAETDYNDDRHLLLEWKAPVPRASYPNAVSETPWDVPEEAACLGQYRTELLRIGESIVPVCTMLLATASALQGCGSCSRQEGRWIGAAGVVCALATVWFMFIFEFLRPAPMDMLPLDDGRLTLTESLLAAGCSQTTIKLMQSDLRKGQHPKRMKSALLDAVERKKPDGRRLGDAAAFARVFTPSLFGAFMPLAPWLVYFFWDPSWSVVTSTGLTFCISFVVQATSVRLLVPSCTIHPRLLISCTFFIVVSGMAVGVGSLARLFSCGREGT
ncbi:hypothetical protein DIPPA_04313 [Diplonema papillatum]|nr:hypothetical protein DIPPA_04313 [Diplonema papillatum]